MPSRQDQLHSYQYANQRVVAALISQDPDPARSPMRRAGMTALVSLLIAAIAVGAVSIYGILTGNSNTSARDSSVILQEKGTGAQFVFLKSDNQLHPVINYSSALLLAEGTPPSVRSLSPKRLAEVPLGPALGIPDAPDSLPSRSALLGGPWSVCTERLDSELRSTVLVGTIPTGGRLSVAAREALLVKAPNGRVSLVEGNRRFAIPAGAELRTQRVLGWAAQTPWPVTTAWINAIPSGPDLAPPRLPGVGGRSPVPGLEIGQLVTDAGQTQFAVLLADGVAAVTELQARLLQAVPGASAPRAVSNFVDLQPSQTKITDAGEPGALPPTVPALAEGTPQRACITVPVRDQKRDGIRIDPTVPSGTAVRASADADQAKADVVFVPRGQGALAVSVTGPNAPESTGAVGVITDTGTMYPLASRDLLGKLGYGKAKPAAVPGEVLSLLPTGPTLDPARAQQIVTAE
ncbi:type VII secretion protein EccB [Actinoplanes sp. TRM 88003]|uniref:Type VII secretion protein EccB n=1 Tax=Paractinoplanes aksuensis TaxID=2939490 RepID=A0ABT1E2Y6_9ACTN|nr:type VII secretion protein EccB [Actinoplanes aksuensis]MCO8277505.1 type VII secretion protein EccB [Actinoplanes aksuensis]